MTLAAYETNLRSVPAETDFNYDLALVGAPLRASTWYNWNTALFKNTSVGGLPREISSGFIRGARLGSGRLFHIRAAGPSVIRRQIGRSGAPLTLVLQISGRSTLRQAERECVLREHDFAFLDGEQPFEKEMTDGNELVLVQMPRPLVQSRHPGIVESTAARFDRAEASNDLIRKFAVSIAESTGQLDPTQRRATLLSLVELLGAATPGSETSVLRKSGHVHRALACIEAQFFRQNFDANSVANEIGLSRRRLDELFMSVVGRSVSAHIWERRLARAAIELQASAGRTRTITEIALHLGFEDSAHFSRAFKKRYNISPTEWRTRGEDQP